MTRRSLPERRYSEILDVYHVETNGSRHPYIITIGTYDDGVIGEVFIDSPKNGSTLGLLCHDAAVAISIALQHGATVEELRASMARHSNDVLDPGELPQSVIGTVLDALAKWRDSRNGN